MNKLNPNWIESRSFAVSVILTFITLESIALIAQYAFNYQPCENCVLVRACLLLIGLSGTLSILTTHMKSKLHWVSLTFTLNFIGLYASLTYLWDIYLIESGKIYGGCSIVSPFPNILPLDKIAPVIFEPKALCGTPAQILPWLSFAELSIIAISLLLLINTALYVRYTIKK